MRTDEQVASDLRRRFAAVVPSRAVDPAPIVRAGRRRRLVARAGAAVSTVAVVALGVLGLQNLGGDRVDDLATTPPPTEAGPVSMWLSADELPTGDHDLALVLLATGGPEVTFGSDVRLERWDGDSWNQRGWFVTCLAEWVACEGALVDRIDAMNDIGFSPTPESPGPVERISTAGLEEGWYRLVREAFGGTQAHGWFRIDDAAPPPPTLPARDMPGLSVIPAVVPSGGGAVALSTFDVPDAEGTSGPGPVPVGAAAVERWTPQGWAQVDEVLLEEPVSDGGLLPLVLPPLDPGTYRLVATEARSDTAITGVFGVLDDDRAPVLAGPEPRAPDGATDPQGEDPSGPPPDALCGYVGDVECVLQTWLQTAMAQAGLEPGGGDHDIGVASQSVRLADDSWLSLVLSPLREDMTGLVEPTGTVEGPDGSRLEMGRTPGYAEGTTLPAAQITCGGFALSVVAEGTPAADALDGAARSLLESLGPCPADLDQAVEVWGDEAARRYEEQLDVP